MFGFLFLVFLILVITCSETTILLCYFHLCAEDYHWWWRSFLTSGFTSVYLFIYCCHYFATKLSIEDAASTFLYFGYTTIMVFLFFLLTGTIGFMACFWFIRKIYSVVKVDQTTNNTYDGREEMEILIKSLMESHPKSLFCVACKRLNVLTILGEEPEGKHFHTSSRSRLNYQFIYCLFLILINPMSNDGWIANEIVRVVVILVPFKCPRCQ